MPPARCEAVYKSDRDDWVLGMVASGFGFGFLPRYSIIHDGIIARPLVDPKYWLNIHLVTVRDKPQSHIVGALVHEAMRTGTNVLCQSKLISRGELVSCSPSKAFNRSAQIFGRDLST